MRWGKPTKSKKRHDPRYFLNEGSLEDQHLERDRGQAHAGDEGQQEIPEWAYVVSVSPASSMPGTTTARYLVSLTKGGKAIVRLTGEDPFKLIRKIYAEAIGKLIPGKIGREGGRRSQVWHTLLVDPKLPNAMELQTFWADNVLRQRDRMS